MRSCRVASQISGIVLCAAWLQAHSQAAGPVPNQTLVTTHGVYSETVKPLLERSCYACHGNGKRKGDLALDRFPDETAIRADPKTWQSPFTTFARPMPPRNKPQPSLEERDLIANWIETDVFPLIAVRPTPAASPSAGSTAPSTTTPSATSSASTSTPPRTSPPTTSATASTTSATCSRCRPCCWRRYLAAAESILQRAILVEMSEPLSGPRLCGAYPPPPSPPWRLFQRQGRPSSQPVGEVVTSFRSTAAANTPSASGPRTAPRLSLPVALSSRRPANWGVWKLRPRRRRLRRFGSQA